MGKEGKDVLCISVVLTAYSPLVHLLKGVLHGSCAGWPHGEDALCTLRLLTAEHPWVLSRAECITQGN